MNAFTKKMVGCVKSFVEEFNTMPNLVWSESGCGLALIKASPNWTLKEDTNIWDGAGGTLCIIDTVKRGTVVVATEEMFCSETIVWGKGTRKTSRSMRWIRIEPQNPSTGTADMEGYVQGGFIPTQRLVSFRGAEPHIKVIAQKDTSPPSMRLYGDITRAEVMEFTAERELPPQPQWGADHEVFNTALETQGLLGVVRCVRKSVRCVESLVDHGMRATIVRAQPALLVQHYMQLKEDARDWLDSSIAQAALAGYIQWGLPEILPAWMSDSDADVLRSLPRNDSAIPELLRQMMGHMDAAVQQSNLLRRIPVAVTPGITKLQHHVRAYVRAYYSEPPPMKRMKLTT
jgi:hypothetical protein